MVKDIYIILDLWFRMYPYLVYSFYKEEYLENPSWSSNINLHAKYLKPNNLMIFGFTASLNIRGSQNTLFWVQNLTFCRRNYFFNFSTPVYKMWIIQEPNKLELWNKLHFEEKKQSVYTMFKIFSTYICWMNIKNVTFRG